MKIALHGHMGRDAAAVENILQNGHQINAIGTWENPNVVDAVDASGGRFKIVSNIGDAKAVADFVQGVEPDLFYTHFDDSLAAGTVDAIKRRVDQGLMQPVLLASPNKESAKVEWDKFFLREILEKVAPEYNPDHNFMVTDQQAAFDAINFFESEGLDLVIKPRNPTGGKGVKVMGQGKHFTTHDEAREYATQVLNDPKQSGLEIQDRMDVDKDGNQIGHEFTLQFITDGNVIIPVPATYDYPYREDGDNGPGTGGMGTFSQADGLLPFLDGKDYQEMLDLGYKLLDEMKDRGLDYKGVLYMTAFKQKPGQKKVIEVNARGGDPELINIVDSFEDGVDYAEVQRLIALGELAQDSVRFKQLASAIVYLVSKGYGYDKEPPVDFDLNWQAVNEADANIRFAAGVRIGANKYRTASTSRILGISALGPTPWAARKKVNDGISVGFNNGEVPFDHRYEVASEGYVKGLSFG